MALMSLVVHMEIIGHTSASKGTPTRGVKAVTTTSGSVYGEIRDYNTPGSQTSSTNGVQNI